MTASEIPAHAIELQSAQSFAATLARLTAALEAAGMTIFARIDHHLGAQQVGLSMPPTTSAPAEHAVHLGGMFRVVWA
jgi:uncharacterized protein (DUF302 family)